MTGASVTQRARDLGRVIAAAALFASAVAIGGSVGATTVPTNVTPMTTCADGWTRIGTSLTCEKTITTSTSLDLPDGFAFDVIVVGGGGGGGGGGGWYMTGPRRDTFTAGGGGGGGQVTLCSGVTFSADPVTVTVGAGGTAGANRTNNQVGQVGGNGGSSSIESCSANGGIGGYGGWGKSYTDWTATLNMGTYGQGGTSGTGKVGMTSLPYNPPTSSTGAYGVWGGGGGGAKTAATSNRGGAGEIPRFGLFATNSIVYGTGGGGANYSQSLSMGTLAATGADFSRVASPAPANIGAGGGGGLGAGAQSTVFVNNASSAGGSGVVVLRYSMTVTIKAKSASSTYGSPITPVSYEILGLGATDWLRPFSCGAYNGTTLITAPYLPGNYTTKCTGGTTTGLGVTVNYVPEIYTLSRAPLTITTANRTATYGDAVTLTESSPTTDWSITSGSLMYSDSISSVTLTTSGTPAGTDSTANAGNYDITPSAAVGANLAVPTASLNQLYDITYTKGTLQKNRAPLTITAHSLQVREGDPEPMYGYDITGWVLGESETTPPAGWTPPMCDAPYVQGTSTVADSPLTIACSGAAATNYSFTYRDAHLLITPAALIVAPQDVYATYDGTTASVPSLDISTVPDDYTFDPNEITCGIYDDPESSTDLTGTVLKPGTYYVVCTGPASAPNVGDGEDLDVVYEVGTFIVNKAKLTVTVLDQTKEYGETDVDITATAYELSGLVEGDLLEAVLDFEDGDLAPSDVGDYAISAELSFAVDSALIGPAVTPRVVDDYYDVQFVPGVLTVTPAVLRVTPEDLAPIFGEEVSDYPYDILETWKNGEGLSNLPADWTPPSCTSTYQPTTPIGSEVEITCSNGAARNYVFEYLISTLTVSDPEVVLTNTSERTYTTSTDSILVNLSATVDKFVPGCEIIWTLDPSEGTNSPYSVYLDDTIPSLEVSLPLGVYVVTVSVDGNCIEKEAIANPAVIVVSPTDVGAGTTGGGWYRTDTNGPKINFGYVVQVKSMGKDKRTGEEVRTYWGQSTWIVKGKWRVKTSIDKVVTQYADGSLSGVQPYSNYGCPPVWSSPVPVDPRCGAFTGEAILQRWVADEYDGHWETVGHFGYRIRVYDGAWIQKCNKKVCQTTDLADFYGLELWSLPDGPAVPDDIQTSAPQRIAQGQVRVGK